MCKTDSGVSWFHRLATLVAVLTFLLAVTGLLASDSGTPFLVFHGADRRISAGTSGKYAHIYTVLAVSVGALTVILALLMRKSNSHPYLKNMGNITVGILVAMVLIVLTPIRLLLSVAEPFAYLCGIQIFFCLTVCLALFTRADWRWDERKTPDLASPSLRQILVFMTAAIFLQPLSGAAFRKREMGMAPHLVLGIVVTVCSLWVLEMALTKYSDLRVFKISAIFLTELVALQLFLGIISYSMDLNARAVHDSQPGLVVMNVTHAAVGMLVLATSLFVAFQAFKYFSPAESLPASPMLHETQAGSAQQEHD